MKQLKFVALAGMAAVVAVGAYWLYGHNASGPGGANREALSPQATPPGVTIQSLGDFRGTVYAGAGLGGGASGRFTYADAKGMTFYTFDKDTEAGKSACGGDCAKTWLPALAAAGVEASGDWSLVAREDGGRQWAFRGKPLYTSTKDAKISEDKGNGSDSGAWHTALFQPGEALALPDGIGVREVPDASAQAFVNAAGMTLYAFEGHVRRDKPTCVAGTVCRNPWTPLLAPGLANPVGDFSLVIRDDETRQWAYKGKALYSFTGDREAGDATGNGLDPRWHTAALVRHFMPAGIAMRDLAGRGKGLTTSDGMTLYRREEFQWMTGGHFFRRGQPRYFSVGRAIGAKCDAECLKTWRPLAAPADALPTGYWSIVTQDDGSKQWAYKGYALFSYAGDKKPGELNGYEIYEYLINDGVHKVSSPPIPLNHAGALYWTIVEP